MKNKFWIILLSPFFLIAQETNSDKLIKTTDRIVNQKENDSLFVGTGFFYKHSIDSTNILLKAIVTNKHVVNNSKRLLLSFRTHSSVTDKGIQKDSIRNCTIDNPSKWVFNHPNPDVDLSIIFLKPIEDYFISVFEEELNISYFTKKLIPDNETINKLSPIEDVIMIGYPKGIIDKTELYPIVRKGITSSPYDVDFNNKKDFLTDIFAIGGSSGSPVILYRYNNAFPILLGVHYGGLHDNKINLGLNLKSTRIIELFNHYEEEHGDEIKEFKISNKEN